MAFTLEIWKKQLEQRMWGWKARMEQGGVKSLYAFLSAVALYPAAEAIRTGDPVMAGIALTTLAGGAGASLLVNQFQSWKDEVDGAKKLVEETENNTSLRDALDDVLQKLNVLQLAEADHMLSESDKQWFTKTIQSELVKLGSRVKYQAYVERGGISFQGDHIHDIQVIVNPSQKPTEISSPAETASPKILREHYLRYVLASTRPLSLTAVDRESAAKPEARMELDAVYTALLTQTPEQDQENWEDAKRMRGEMRSEKPRQLSALEQLNSEKHLVLLGDPGSGKSTFVNFVAMCLAGAGLDDASINIALLTQPIPSSEGKSGKEEKKPVAQPWNHRALLPVRVILREFASRGLPEEKGEHSTAKHLQDFIATELQPICLDEGFPLKLYPPYLRSELREKGGLLLLDGLDEVPDAMQRRPQIKEALESFGLGFPRCRILVTSRTYAYQNEDWRLRDFKEAVLSPLNEGQIRYFIGRWYAHYGKLSGMRSDDIAGRAGRLERAVLGNPKLLDLAKNPLLLTLTASLHAWRSGELPEKRVMLYSETVDLLLNRWERKILRFDKQGNPVDPLPGLAEYLKVDQGKLLKQMNQLAFEMHRSQLASEKGTADIPVKELVGALLHISKSPEAKANPELLVEYLSQRAGLLLPISDTVYRFPHRTLQEYLAACHLADDQNYPEPAATLGRTDPDRWREVVLLCGARAEKPAMVWSLADALCPRAVGVGVEDMVDQWGARLAGQLLVESASLEDVGESNRTKLERIQDWLVHILESNRLSAVERASAGDTLARLGDPRFDPDAWYLPKDDMLGFVHIPAGEFLMGSSNEDGLAQDWEKPQHKLDLPEYYIAKFPVTVAQFRSFVEDSGYRPTDANCLKGLANHPVVDVTWYDALEYCEWLNAKLLESDQTPVLLKSRLAGKEGGKPWRVLLPSEAEWEKAARGTDGIIYPWGNEFDADKANTGETGIGGTSAVGCFAGNGGIYDMSGNVWEWTRSEYKKYPYQSDDGREDLTSKADHRVLRGGAFNGDLRVARCAYRFGFNPDLRSSDLGFRLVVVPFRL